MVLLRSLLGDVLRRHRLDQARTLREVSSSARISLGYLSEVERGVKEASSELLAAICDALDLRLSELLTEVAHEVAGAEPAVPAVPAVPALTAVAVPADTSTSEPADEPGHVVAAA